tara:strand:+ start:389 stop:751 length:363 start_codon:yes stop_codon:yes gene_type:complete
MSEIEKPENFSKSILRSEVLERFNDGLLRVVSVPDADVRERITWTFDEKKVVSTLVGHPQLSGQIIKTVEAGAEDTWIMSTTLNWQSIDEGVDQMVKRKVEGFVQECHDHIKAASENMTP